MSLNVSFYQFSNSLFTCEWKVNRISWNSLQITLTLHKVFIVGVIQAGVWWQLNIFRWISSNWVTHIDHIDTLIPFSSFLQLILVEDIILVAPVKYHDLQIEKNNWNSPFNRWFFSKSSEIHFCVCRKKRLTKQFFWIWHNNFIWSCKEPTNEMPSPKNPSSNGLFGLYSRESHFLLTFVFQNYQFRLEIRKIVQYCWTPVDTHSFSIFLAKFD